MTKRITRLTMLVGISAGLLLFPTLSLAETAETSATATSTGGLVDGQAEIGDQLQADRDQFLARQQQIAQDLADARQRREQRQVDLHHDFEAWQDQLDQNHKDFQTHVAEINDRLAADHAAIENTWTDTQQQVDQAKSDINQKISEAENLQAQLKASQATIDENLSQVKDSGQTIQNKLAEGTDEAKATEGELENRTGDVAGAISRIKATIDSAGTDHAADDSTTVQAVETPKNANQDATPSTATEYPQTNDQKNNLLPIIGIGIIGGVGFYFLRKNHS